MNKIIIWSVTILLGYSPQLFSAAGGVGSSAAAPTGGLSRAARLKYEARLAAAAGRVVSHLMSSRRGVNTFPPETSLLVPPSLPPKDVLERLAGQDRRPARERLLDSKMPTYSADEFRAGDGVPNEDVDTDIREGAIRNDLRYFTKYSGRLVDFDAKARYKAGKNSTPLMFAALNNSIEAAQFLLAQRTVNPFNVDIDGATAFAIACDYGYLELARILYDNMTERRSRDTSLPDFVNMPDINGKTALMYACDNNYPVIVSFLINHGASTTQKDKDGHDAYWYAHGFDEIRDMIIQYEEDHGVVHSGDASDEDDCDEEEGDEHADAGHLHDLEKRVAGLSLGDID